MVQKNGVTQGDFKMDFTNYTDHQTVITNGRGGGTTSDNAAASPARHSAAAASKIQQVLDHYRFEELQQERESCSPLSSSLRSTSSPNIITSNETSCTSFIAANNTAETAAETALAVFQREDKFKHDMPLNYGGGDEDHHQHQHLDTLLDCDDLNGQTPNWGAVCDLHKQEQPRNIKSETVTGYNHPMALVNSSVSSSSYGQHYQLCTNPVIAVTVDGNRPGNCGPDDNKQEGSVAKRPQDVPGIHTHKRLKSTPQSFQTNQINSPYIIGNTAPDQNQQIYHHLPTENERNRKVGEHSSFSEYFDRRESLRGAVGSAQDESDEQNSVFLDQVEDHKNPVTAEHKLLTPNAQGGGGCGGGEKDLQKYMKRTDFGDYYPDGGWGWVVCVGAAVVHFLIYGLHLSGGTLHLAVAREFPEEVRFRGLYKLYLFGK